MATVVFDYNENDRTASGLFGAIAAIPGIRAFFGANILTEQKSKEERAKDLLDRAKKLDVSINKQAPQITMAEIVQEVRDYRNGK
jgi:hypothetical protein